MTSRISVTLCACLFATACQTIDNDEEKPALIVDRTDAVQSEIQAAVNDAMGGGDVLIADNAFAENSRISIEQRLPGSIDRQQTIGRDYSTPAQFQLVKRGEQCYLVDTRTDRRFLLESASCTPE